MGHLLKLADEYDVQGVLDLCIKCLQDMPKSEVNVVTILYLATDTLIASEDYRLDGVRDASVKSSSKKWTWPTSL